MGKGHRLHQRKGAEQAAAEEASQQHSTVIVSRLIASCHAAETEMLRVYSPQMQWLDDDFADSCDFELIGLSSHLPPQRLCWELNRSMGWSLAFSHMLEIAHKKDQLKPCCVPVQ